MFDARDPLIRFVRNPVTLSLLNALSVFATFSAHAVGLNDTGQTLCYDAAGTVISCTAPAGVATDDGRYGRDAAAAAGALTKTGAGAAGFDFTKIANDGSALAAGAALGSNPTDWACTQDNVTGLMWEVKTTSGLRSSAYIYTWYDSNSATNGGNAGTVSGGTCLTAGRCDTEKFVQDVNAVNLCGHSDWRLPSLRELKTIVHQGVANPSIDTTYFPNTVASLFWSASTYIPLPTHAWLVNFSDGPGNAYSKSFSYFYVRLVRGGQF